MQKCLGHGANDAIHSEAGMMFVEDALQYLPGVLAAGIEIMVPQEELNARMGVRTNPGTDGGGIVQNILKTAFPGFFLFSGVKQGFEAVEYGGFKAVADAADFPLAALVSGRKAGNAQGGRPGRRDRLQSGEWPQPSFFL